MIGQPEKGSEPGTETDCFGNALGLIWAAVCPCRKMNSLSHSRLCQRSQLGHRHYIWLFGQQTLPRNSARFERRRLPPPREKQTKRTKRKAHQQLRIRLEKGFPRKSLQRLKMIEGNTVRSDNSSFLFSNWNIPDPIRSDPSFVVQTKQGQIGDDLNLKHADAFFSTGFYLHSTLDTIEGSLRVCSVVFTKAKKGKAHSYEWKVNKDVKCCQGRPEDLRKNQYWVELYVHKYIHRTQFEGHRQFATLGRNKFRNNQISTRNYFGFSFARVQKYLRTWCTNGNINQVTIDS